MVQKGDKTSLALSQPVAYMANGAFSEYITLNEREAIPVPDIRKEYLSLLVSGLTAGISLEKTAELKEGTRMFNQGIIDMNRNGNFCKGT